MSDVILEKDGAIATVILSNRGKLNAISVAMWKALHGVFEQIAQDETLRCVIVRGDGADFAAGADIDEFPHVRATKEQAIHYHTALISPALDAIAQCALPTLAAIEGVCVGGGLEIACACDMRISSSAARFGIPVNRLGFPLAPDELQGLLSLAGKAATLEILLEGRIFNADDAKEKGLIHRIVADVPAHVREMAQRIAAGAPLAARMNKKLIHRLSPGITALTAQELQDAFAYMSSADYHDGVQSFIEKRTPRFTGK